ncbi:MAG: hypothetical protein ACLPGW_19975 [Roseiarcus sp.]
MRNPLRQGAKLADCTRSSVRRRQRRQAVHCGKYELRHIRRQALDFKRNAQGKSLEKFGISLEFPWKFLGNFLEKFGEAWKSLQKFGVVRLRRPARKALAALAATRQSR